MLVQKHRGFFSCETVCTADINPLTQQFFLSLQACQNKPLMFVITIIEDNHDHDSPVLKLSGETDRTVIEFTSC